RRVERGPQLPRGSGRARGAARDALLRALRPYSVHQRLVDQELLRALRTMDERIGALAGGQSALAAQLRRRDEDEGPPVAPSAPR
ncbi:MAG: hypothetical protein H0W03_07860, partial [Solirubrobacterales bacterium]|nr:hypothetical protein [Solirubrobacterales bacterium]